MQNLRKSIITYTGEKYRDLAYGIIYFVPGILQSDINDCVLAQIDEMEAKLNRNVQNWIQCKIVYQDYDNPLFQPQTYATLYSALLPISETPEDSYSFLAASLGGVQPAQVESVVAIYFAALQQLFDDVLDGGTYALAHLQEKEIDDRIRFCISRNTYKKEAEQAEEPPIITVPSRLVITEYQYRFMLPDYNREIKFGAQIKALYVLFLLHPEGIRMQEISDYKQEFTMLYRLFTNRSDMDALMLKIERLLDVLNPNALNVKKSQCRKALQEAIPEDYLRQYYEIEVHRGEAHTISLDRSLVIYPATLLYKINK